MLGCWLVTGKPIDPVPSGDYLFALENAYWRPEPCVSYKAILSRYASAAADISDGLLADVSHITWHSQACATLNFDALPFSMGAEKWAESQSDPISARRALASFGDDYGVVFTSNAQHRQAIFDLARQAKLKLTLVGSVLDGDGAVCLDIDGKPMEWLRAGYKHK